MIVEYVYRGRKNLGDRFYVFLYSASLAKGLSGALVTDTHPCFYLGIMYHSDISQAHSTDCRRMTEYLKSRLPNKFNFYLCDVTFTSDQGNTELKFVNYLGSPGWGFVQNLSVEGEEWLFSSIFLDW